MRIVLCYPVESRHIAQIQAVAGNAEIIDAGQEGIAAALPTADVFCGHAKVPVDWDEVVRRGRLRWIQSSAAGMDHCLVPSVIGSEILVSSASGVFADQVAEQTMALLLGFLRQMRVFFRQQQSHEFVRQPTLDLHDKTIGIVGFGGNGQRIAEVLAPFRVRILATDAFPESAPPHVEAVWPSDALDDLLAASDIVILTLPLNANTRHLLDTQRLGAMRPGAVLVNVARGPVVDEAALVTALQAGRLGGAALDVTEIEPLPDDSPLWDRPEVLITPHVGAQSARRIDDATDFFCLNLRRYLDGQPVWNRLDKNLGFPRPHERAPADWRRAARQALAQTNR